MQNRLAALTQPQARGNARGGLKLEVHISQSLATSLVPDLAWPTLRLAFALIVSKFGERCSISCARLYSADAVCCSKQYQHAFSNLPCRGIVHTPVTSSSFIYIYIYISNIYP